MIEKSITTSGCVTYWQLPGHADLESVAAAFDAAGLGHLAPKKPSKSTALRDALAELYREKDILVRPLRAGGGWNVVREHKNGTRNTYSVLLSATFGGGADNRVTIDPDDQQERIMGELDKQQTRASRTAIAASLAAAIPCLHGVTLRDSGGIYYLPPHAETMWERLAVAMEGAAPGTCVYRLRTAHGKEELRAIRDAAIADLTAEADRIREECRAGMTTMREGTAVLRRGQIADLRDRLTIYRDLLGEGLQTISEAIDDADATAVAVQLAATARLRNA